MANGDKKDEFKNLKIWVGQQKKDVRVVVATGIATILILILVLWHLVRTKQEYAILFHFAIPAETVKVEMTPLEKIVGASGTIQPSATVNLTARVTAQVKEIPKDLGQIVKKGEQVIVFDDRQVSAQLTSFQACLDRDKAQFDREQKLHDLGMASESDLESARAIWANSNNNAVTAQISVENAKVLSPVTGIIQTRIVNIGETPNVGSTMMEIGALEQVFMVAQVAQEEVSFISVGLTAEVGCDPFPGEVFKGEVVKIDPNITVATRTFDVYIKIENPDLRLRPGATGYARIDDKKNSLTVVSTAVRNPVGDQPTVIVVDASHHAHFRPVRLGIVTGGRTEILEGLQQGEEVVAVGHTEIRENDEIYPNQRKPSGP